MKTELIYLAVPFSHPDLAVREFRYKEANRISAILMKRGIPVYSPISHGYPIALEGGLPTSWEFWEKYLRAILPACSAVYVLMLDGWNTSIGVQAEIKLAEELGIPVEYKDPNEES